MRIIKQLIKKYMLCTLLLFLQMHIKGESWREYSLRAENNLRAQQAAQQAAQKTAQQATKAQATLPITQSQPKSAAPQQTFPPLSTYSWKPALEVQTPQTISHPTIKLNADQLGAMNAEQLRNRVAELKREARKDYGPAMRVELQRTQRALKEREREESLERRFGPYKALPYTQAPPRGRLGAAWDRLRAGRGTDTYGMYYKDLKSEQAEGKKQQNFLESLKRQEQAELKKQQDFLEGLKRQEKKEREERMAISRQNELFRQAEAKKQETAINKEIEERKKARRIRAPERAREIERWRATPEYKRLKAEYQEWEKRYVAELAQEQAEHEEQEATRIRPYERLKAVGGVSQAQLEGEEKWREEQTNAALQKSQQALARYKRQQELLEEQRLEKERKEQASRETIWQRLGRTRRPPLPPAPAEQTTPEAIKEMPVEQEAPAPQALKVKPKNVSDEAMMSGSGFKTESAGSPGEARAQAYSLTLEEKKIQDALVDNLAADDLKLKQARKDLRQGASATKPTEQVYKLTEVIKNGNQALEQIRQILEKDLSIEERKERLRELAREYAEKREALLGKEAQLVEFASFQQVPIEQVQGPAVPISTIPEQQTAQKQGEGLIFDPEINNVVVALQGNIKKLQKDIGELESAIGYKTGFVDNQEKIEQAKQEITIIREALGELERMPQSFSRQEKRNYTQTILERANQDIKEMHAERDLAYKEKEERIEQARERWRAEQ